MSTIGFRRAVPGKISLSSRLLRREGERRWYQFELEVACPDLPIRSVQFVLHASFGALANETVSSPPFRIQREAWAENVVVANVDYGAATPVVLRYHVQLYNRLPRPVPLSGVNVGETLEQFAPRDLETTEVFATECDYWWVESQSGVISAWNAQEFEANLEAEVKRLAEETFAISRALQDSQSQMVNVGQVLQDVDRVALEAGLTL